MGPLRRGLCDPGATALIAAGAQLVHSAIGNALFEFAAAHPEVMDTELAFEAWRHVPGPASLVCAVGTELSNSAISDGLKRAINVPGAPADDTID